MHDLFRQRFAFCAKSKMLIILIKYNIRAKNSGLDNTDNVLARLLTRDEYDTIIIVMQSSGDANSFYREIYFEDLYNKKMRYKLRRHRFCQFVALELLL